MASYLARARSSGNSIHKTLSNSSGSELGLVTPPSSGYSSVFAPGGIFGMMPLHVDSSFGADLSTDEAVQKLQDLMKENNELKGTVRQNNEVMRSLHDVLTEMKGNWDKERADNMDKFEQARKVVTALRKDLDAKKSEIEEFNRQLQSKKSERETEASTISSAQVEALYSELEQCKTNLSCWKKEREIHSKEMDNLKIKMEQSNKRNAEMAQNDREMEEQLQHYIETCESHENKMSQLVQHNKKLTDTNQKIIEEREELSTKIRDLQAQLNQSQERQSESPDSLSHRMQESFVLVDETDHPGVSSDDKQTHRKYPLDSHENKDVNKYENEKKSEKDEIKLVKSEEALAGALSQLEEERKKVVELTAQVNQLNGDLASNQNELYGMSTMNSQMEILFAEHKIKEEQLMQQLDLLQRQQHRNQHSQSPQENVESMKAQVVSLLNEVQESNKRQAEMQGMLHSYQTRCHELERQCGMMQEELESQRSKDDHLIDALRGTISEMENSLASQKEQNERKGTIIEEYERQVQSLQKDCSTYKYKMEEYKNKSAAHSSDGTVVMTVSQKRKLDEKLDNLTAQVLSAEDSLLAKQEEIQKLQQKLILLRTESEDIPYLKAQIESYKSDFQAERQACVRLRQDKKSYHDELESQRLINQQLKEQIDRLSSMHRHQSPLPNHRPMPGQHAQYVNNGRREAVPQNSMRGRPYPGGGFDECDITSGKSTQNEASLERDGRRPSEHSLSSQGSASGAAAMSAAAEPLVNDYVCPSCGLKTLDIDSLTIHVDECLNNSQC